MKTVFFVLLSLAITYNSFALRVSYNFESDACWLHSYERTGGEPASKPCQEGYELHNGRCYLECPYGTTFDSEKETCFQDCPEGFDYSDYALCRTKNYDSKTSGYATSEECRKNHRVGMCPQIGSRHFPDCYGKELYSADACFRDDYSRKASFAPKATSCSEGLEMINGLCYQKCPEGHKANGLTCANQCPNGYSVCGNVCLKEKTCTKSISDLKMKDLEVATIGSSMTQVLAAFDERSLAFKHPICA